MVAKTTLIRRAMPGDIGEIHEIERESFPDPWDPDTFHEVLYVFPATFFVATDGMKVIGFITGALENTSEEIYGHIMNLAVSLSHRGQGIGKRLVERIEHQYALLGASGVQLEVRVSNTAAQAFYRTLGYQPVFQIVSYYRNGEDAIVMMKWFHMLRDG